MSSPCAITRRLVTLAVLVALALALAACRSATSRTGTVGEVVPCQPNVRIIPGTGTPGVSAATAEAQARARYSQGDDPARGQYGALLEARYVTIVAGDQAWQEGQGRWLLTFAFQPPASQASQTPFPGTAWRAYALTDTVSGFPLASCSGLLPSVATPAP